MTDCTKLRAKRRAILRRNDRHRVVRGATPLLAVALLGLFTLASAAEATSDRLNAQTRFNIPAQPLGLSLKQLANQAGIQILFEEQIVSGREAPAVEARETPLQALSALLKGTGLEFTAKNGTVAVRKKSLSTTRYERGGAADGDADRSSGQSPDQQFQLEEIIVTAQHREEKLRDVPMGITALTGDVLDKSQNRSFEDYVALVPGLSLKQGVAGVPGSNRLSLRGLNAQGVGATVAVYVDDTPFGSSSALANGAILASNFDPWDMQRIEVLRGPQGMFYGASSEGGLLKFVTTAPNPEAFAGAVEVGGESVDHGSNGWSGKGMLNMPLGEKAAARISASSEHLPGYVDDPFRDRRNVNTATKNDVRASLLFAPAEDLKIRLTAFYQDLETNGTPFVDVNAERQPVYGDFTQKRATDEKGKYRYDNYTATVNWNLGWANVLSATSYAVAKNSPFQDLTYTSIDNAGHSYTSVLSNPNSYANQSGPLPTGPVGAYLINEAGLRKFVQEVRLQSSPSERLEWEVGGFYTHESASLRQPFPMFSLPDGAPFGPPGYSYLLFDLESKYQEAAGFGSVTYHFNPQLDVQFGGRWSHNTQSFVNEQSSDYYGIVPMFTSGLAASRKFLYSVAPRWHVRDNWLLYARIASGYQPGGPNILPLNSPVEVPTQFQPDSTVNYEVGMRAQLLDQRLLIDLAFFRIDWTKVQLNQIIDTAQGQVGIIGNGGTATSQGVEWTVAMVPVKGLTLSLTGAYIDARLTSDAPAVGGKSGDELPDTPKWSTSLDAEYGWNIFANYRTYVGGTWIYSGDQVGYFSTLADTRARLPGYTTANLRAGLQHDLWTVSLYAKNVTNKHAAQSFIDSTDPAFPGTGIFNQPRTIGIAASIKF